ncbi:YceI family protein [Sphaerisporangium perillae]|uniref:YceI family protein n=1 Tax=Sphaerisporangium perillae TaxID=2935860 RepID=UPI00200D08EC|nr:YceI family protein [Sphaerisporangium perillae]
MTTTTKLSELTGDYVLDTAHTRIGFVARHTMATKVRGQFDEFEGSARLDGEDPSKSSTELTIQAKSIQTRNQRRDEHLRSKFLDTDNHPTITFTSIGVEQVDDTSFKVTGDLTILGVTKPVTVDFELTGAENDPWGDFRVGFEGSVTIDRKDWGVNWNAATGVLVSEKVTLEFDVAAIRRS